MATFILKLDAPGDGPRVAVKDLIDMEGLPTTAGSRAVARRAMPAGADAPCLAGIRAANARVVGKTNLHELAMSATGINPWFGTPPNPVDPARVPGGSSSGSAAAVGSGEADVALGSDTGGSVRIPSACCGTAGLKTTYGRIPLAGVWPLAHSLDTVGPMARDVAGLVLGMQLLEPGFQTAPAPARRIGRLRTLGHRAIEAAVDNALRRAGLEVVDIDLPEWQELMPLFTTLFVGETWEADHHLLTEDADGLGADAKGLLALGEAFAGLVVDARRQLEALRSRTTLSVFDQVELVALPTMPIFPPRIDAIGPDPQETVLSLARHTPFANVTGLPALAIPVPTGGAAAGVPGADAHLPASLQLIAPANREDLLLATGALVEAAVG